MNKALSALMTKLKWQLSEINQQLQTVDERLLLMKQKIDDLSLQIQKATTIAATIQPEQEIARLNFIIQQQQNYEHNDCEKKELEFYQLQLKKKQDRLRIELKMLEKYQEKMANNKIKKNRLKQQNEGDELAIQGREINED